MRDWSISLMPDLTWGYTDDAQYWGVTYKGRGKQYQSIILTGYKREPIHTGVFVMNAKSHGYWWTFFDTAWLPKQEGFATMYHATIYGLKVKNYLNPDYPKSSDFESKAQYDLFLAGKVKHPIYKRFIGDGL